MDKLSSYEANAQKMEFKIDGSVQNHESLKIDQSRAHTILTYLSPGTTGIKNNGMTAEYDGSPKLKVILGKAKGLGVIANISAKAIVGNGIRYDDLTILTGEYLTINRAGFFPLAETLRTQLLSLSNDRASDQNTGLLVRDSGCDLKYVPHTDKFAVVKLGRDTPIADLEDQFGTFAFFIQLHNLKLFSSLHDIFVRDKEYAVKIPLWFPSFELDLEAASKLPTRLRLYWDGKMIAEYIYTVTKTTAK